MQKIEIDKESHTFKEKVEIKASDRRLIRFSEKRDRSKWIEESKLKRQIDIRNEIGRSQTYSRSPIAKYEIETELIDHSTSVDPRAFPRTLVHQCECHQRWPRQSNGQKAKTSSDLYGSCCLLWDSSLDTSAQLHFPKMFRQISKAAFLRILLMAA